MIKEFLKDESGQAVTEYIVMMAMVVSLILLAMKNLIRPAYLRLTQAMNERIEKAFFGADLHTYRGRQ